MVRFELNFTFQLCYDNFSEQIGVGGVGGSCFDGDCGRFRSESVSGDFVLSQSVNREVKLGRVANRIVGRKSDEDRKNEEQPVGKGIEEVLNFLHFVFLDVACGLRKKSTNRNRLELRRKIK